MIDERDGYISIVMGKCVETFDEKLVKVGQNYRLGIRYNQLLKKEVYYVLDVKGALGIPVYVDQDSGYFEEEEYNSISFILGC